MHISGKILLVATMLLAAMMDVCAQQFIVRGLPTQRLLPVAKIHCMMQDSEGYMWYVTNGGGLCRDNGYQLDLFFDSCLTDHYIECLAEDARQGILIGTSHGLYRIDKTDYKVMPFLEKQVGLRYVSSVYRDCKGRIWIAVADKIVRYDSSNNDIREYVSTYSGRTVAVSAFGEDGKGNVWCCQFEGGMMMYDSHTDRFVEQAWDYAYYPNKIVVTDNGFFVSTWGGGIVRYDPVSKSVIQQLRTMGSPYKQQVLDFICDSRQGLFWVTTMDDVYLYQNNEGMLTPLDLPLPFPKGNKIVDRLCEDDNGNIWVSGFSPRSFIIMPGNSLCTRYTIDSMVSLTNYPLLADRTLSDGRMFWIWQGRYGLVLFNPYTGDVTDAGGIYYSQCIEKVLNGQGIWAAHDSILFRLHTKGTQSVIHSRKKVFKGIITCLKQTDGGKLLVGTSEGLYCYTELGDNVTTVTECGKVSDIAVDRNGRPYCLTEKGGIYSGNRLLLTNDIYSSITVTPDGTLWASTKHGDVCRYVKGAFQRYDVASGSSGNIIRQLETDGTGHLWVLSDQWVKEVNPRLASARTIFSDDQLVDVGYFYHLSPFGTSSMILSGAGAVCIVSSSDKLDREKDVGSRAMVSAVTFGDSVHIMCYNEHSVVIPSGTNSVSLRLTSLLHAYADNITFAYRLNHDGAKWVYLPQGVNIVTLGHLPYGKTSVHIKSTDQYGSWGNEVSEIVIYRSRPWWTEWWAIGALVMVACALLYGLYLLGRRIRQLHLLQKKRKEITLTEIELHPEELSAAKIDQAFLQQAVSVVERNLSDCDYSITQFGADLCMSRMNLYRRIQSLTGMSPSEFIRDIRLKKAAQIIKSNPAAPVNEVAAKVGFSTPSYFTKCFKQKFGVLPSKF